MGSQGYRSGLERARAAARLSLADVAVAVCRDVQTVRRWEAGRNMPHKNTMLRLSQLYACPVEALVD